MNAKDGLSFAADAYNRYPGEQVQLFLRLNDAPARGSAQVVLSEPLRVEYFGLNVNAEAESQQVYATDDSQHIRVFWHWDQIAPNLRMELTITARLDAAAPEGFTCCQALLLDADGKTMDATGIRLMVRRQANSLRYLPEIYSEDDFTNRFLMLLESFWTPISQQIDQSSCYFDPYLTPSRLLPWLGSWFGLEFDDSLPEARKRDLLAKILPIYAHKGTRQALVDFLSLYTGGTVEIVERRDTNLVLGPSACLGCQVALGKDNHPHSFEVHLSVPAATVGESAESRERYHKRVEALISQYKPAHTVFQLDLQYA